jgi:hypothetical protein
VAVPSRIGADTYAVAPDGRFLVAVPTPRADQIVTLINWTGLLDD